jgi:lipopolysaccharide/colanic/teichoic acid biosynthesis glycosyltransferase
VAEPVAWRAKEIRERTIGAIAFVVTSPLLAAAAIAIKVEGLVDRRARGPVLFREARISHGREIELLKLRTLTREALASLGPGPTHIKHLEESGTTRVGAVLKAWYLDELPQLWNIARGDMLLIGTRPYPIELYEEELALGVTRKRDMPAGLIGPVQARKGEAFDPNAADAEYLAALQHWSAWRLLVLDLRILWRSARVVLEHRGL